MDKYVINQDDGISGELHDGAGTFNVLISRETTGAVNFSLLHNVCKPGVITKLHDHEVEHAIYILHGRGTLTVGQETYSVMENSTIYIPPNTPHSLFTREGEPLDYLVIYSPPGPETQLLADGAAAFRKGK
jgi:mannose-6-phosphate isomerase-like protein (cupin superfamily)